MIIHLSNQLKKALVKKLFNTQILCVLTNDEVEKISYQDYLAFHLLERKKQKEGNIDQTEITFRFYFSVLVYHRDVDLYASVYKIVDTIFDCLFLAELKIPCSRSITDQGDSLNDEGRYTHTFDLTITTNVTNDCLEELEETDKDIVYTSINLTVEPKED